VEAPPAAHAVESKADWASALVRSPPMDEFKGWAYDVVLELLKSSDKSAHPQLSDAHKHFLARANMYS
jgi:hypothetical protein